MNWSDIYRDEIERSGGSIAFVDKKAREKKVLLENVITYSSPGGRILEAGCGTGANSVYLASLGYLVNAIDNDDEMLKLSEDIASNFNKRPSFVKMDISQTVYADKTFDAVFSHGVLEHFKDQDIVNILNEQLRIGKHVIFSVPSDYFSEKDKMYGDERFMNNRQWKELLEGTDGNIVNNFGYHYEGFLRKVTATFPRLLLNHSPYIGFVIESKKNL
jgi:2-polyprenyl-3-methyl-5-hydroxy-6-metoxy-1,4-benzoquinol methylase